MSSPTSNSWLTQSNGIMRTSRALVRQRAYWLFTSSKATTGGAVDAGNPIFCTMTRLGRCSMMPTGRVRERRSSLRRFRALRLCFSMISPSFRLGTAPDVCLWDAACRFLLTCLRPVSVPIRGVTWRRRMALLRLGVGLRKFRICPLCRVEAPCGPNRAKPVFVPG